MFKQRSKKYKAIGINIYGGGFTLGVMKHFEVLGQWEEINLGRRTFDMNFKGLYRPLDIKDWPIKSSVGKAHLVFANPPCAPWSSANTHLGKTKASRFLDPRLALTDHTYRAAIKLQPEIFISESVEAGYNIGASHYDQYVELWMKAGYSVTFFLCDAILQGAPCMRRRFHFVAHKAKLQLGNPPKTVKAKTVRETIEDLERVDGQVSLHEMRPINEHILKVASLTIPGTPLRKTLATMKNYKGPGIGFLVKRLMYDAPAFTMVGFNYIHPTQDRWITFREAMRLCTYPDTFMAHNAVEAVDAVLPSVAEFLAKVAKKTIVKNEHQSIQFNKIDWRPLAKGHHIGDFRRRQNASEK
jgi:site-specific DNA-cytosine methylase